MHILVGNPEMLAIESCVDEFVAQKSQMGIGYFLIHVGGRQYGVKKPRACVMGNSYNEIVSRISQDGKHILNSSSKIDSKELSIYILNSIYNRGFEGGVIPSQWSKEIDDNLYANALIWAPDGDSAFDDGSHVVQVDDGQFARITAFINAETQDEFENSISDVILRRETFYETLGAWAREFDGQWKVFLNSLS
ncbi:hypothetical protein GGR46_004026 [Sphingomonas kyeonggiensis]|uniref:Uncharacterized protein n=2 Tax=Sphingomonas kyeonggiensis TaxID=1268553 RepID=A0A7W6JVQ5_9SPHN|nr:Imm42 family immunity protein [Sphingomonas kyeonggiensis]MBB4100454.1 hypothetical protein [Sphingomonas kyeonggiensis]